MIRFALALPFAALGVAACDPPMRTGMPAPGIECVADRLDSLIGTPRSAEAEARAKQLSGANAVRWLEPGAIVTMEFRADRLNLHLDAAGKIVSAKCG